jgi:predicted signal transduction protein with EAL and GGDEF domain
MIWWVTPRWRSACGSIWLHARRLEELRLHGSVLDYECQWRSKSGGIHHVSISAGLVDVENQPLVLAFIQDINERKEAQARIDFLAHHDPLTGLPNRVLFRDRLSWRWHGPSTRATRWRCCTGLDHSDHQ